MSDQQQTQEQQIMRRLMIAFCDKGTSLLFDTNSFNNVTAFLDFLSRCWMKDIPPNHLLVERWYYHSDGSKITLLPWRWYYHGGGSKKSSIAQKTQSCQIHSEMEEKFFTPTALVLLRPRKQCNFTSVTVVLQRLYQEMIWRIVSQY